MAASVPRRHLGVAIVVAVLVLIAAAVGGWNIYQKRAIRDEKARFAQAEQDIDKLSADIIAVTGQPLKVEKKKFCSRPNLKFQEGPLSCSIEAVHFYPIENPDKANVQYQAISSVAQKQLTKSKTEYLGGTNEKGNFQKIVIDSSDSFNGAQRLLEHYAFPSMSCKMNYTFYDGNDPPYDNYPPSEGSAYLLATTINCSDKSTIEHFPLNS